MDNKKYSVVTAVTVIFALLVMPFSTIAVTENEESHLITATGFGAISTDKVKHKNMARMMALRAAQVDALRRLSEELKKVTLQSGLTVEDYEVTSDAIATRVHSFTQGAIKLSADTQEVDGEIVATVELALCKNDIPKECENLPTLEALFANE